MAVRVHTVVRSADRGSCCSSAGREDNDEEDANAFGLDAAARTV
jgi:hypothetical protein